jgi:peptidoglycan/xylan/chitin deacetylase (PgdA/CDA1 family)
MKPTELMRATAPGQQTGGAGAFVRSTSIISIASLLLFFGDCSVLRATHPKSSERRSAGVPETTGPFGEVVRGPRGNSEIALTFDAGADADCFEDLIAALESARVHSTFFVTGNWAQHNRDCAEAITKHGHEVGNHTWNHLDLTKQPDDIVRDEITRAEVMLNEISGQSPRPRWRAPYGARDDRVLRIATNLGYRSIYWTIDSLDSVEPKKSSPFLIDRITSKSDAELDGAIILMHVGVRSTAAALPAIIANLQGRGFHLVTISKLLQSAPKAP